jgi:hypothetical protein
VSTFITKLVLFLVQKLLFKIVVEKYDYWATSKPSLVIIISVDWGGSDLVTYMHDPKFCLVSVTTGWLLCTCEPGVFFVIVVIPL